jgi:glutathione peroxidase-family protein
MARQGKVAAVLAVVLLLAVAGRGLAEGVKVGDAAPKWSDIIGVDGKKHGLDEYAKAKLLVLVVTCNHCPVAVLYEDRLIELQKDYKGKGVRVVAVNVNNLEEDRLEPMKKRAKDKKFNFPYLYDRTQKIGHDYGATNTPHFFVLDGERKVAYIGALDDNNDSKKVKVKYLRDALDSLLKGDKPPKTETTARGCDVKYD